MALRPPDHGKVAAVFARQNQPMDSNRRSVRRRSFSAMRKFTGFLLTLNALLVLTLLLTAGRRAAAPLAPPASPAISVLELADSIHLERSRGGWRLVRPIAWPANDYFVESLVARVAADGHGPVGPLAVDDLMDRRLLYLNIYAVQRIVFSLADCDFGLEKIRGHWEFFSPPSAVPNREKLAEFLGKLRNLRCERWLADGSGPGAPLLEIAVEDGLRVERMQFFRRQEQVVVCIDGIHYFELSPSALDDLMTSFFCCRSRRLFHQNECHSLTLDLPTEHFTLQRTFDLPDRWGIIVQNGQQFDFYEGDGEVIDDFFRTLRRTTILNFVCENASSDVFYGHNFNRPLAVINWDGTVYKVARRDGKTFAFDEERGAIYEIEPSQWLDIYGLMFRRKILLQLPESAAIVSARLGSQRQRVELVGPVLERLQHFLSPLRVGAYLPIACLPSVRPQELTMAVRSLGPDGIEDGELDFQIYLQDGDGPLLFYPAKNVLFSPTERDRAFIEDLLRPNLGRP